MCGVAARIATNFKQYRYNEFFTVRSTKGKLPLKILSQHYYTGKLRASLLCDESTSVLSEKKMYLGHYCDTEKSVK